MSKKTHFQKILQQIIEDASSQAPTAPLRAIFDLDSTLFDVSPRTTAILHAFASDKDNAKRFKDECAILAKVKSENHAYKVKETLMRYGMTSAHPDFGKSLITYWRQHFFSNEFLKHDRPYEGAREYVDTLLKAGADIYYLTGRDVPRMKKGTVKQLQEHGFPINAEHTNLILKPDESMDDTVFKKDFFMEVDHLKGPIWFFENEPANINLVLDHCPHIKVVYVETVHSGRDPEVNHPIPRIQGYLA